jgi:hypothetical protein
MVHLYRGRAVITTRHYLSWNLRHLTGNPPVVIGEFPCCQQTCLYVQDMIIDQAMVTLYEVKRVQMSRTHAAKIQTASQLIESRTIVHLA